MFFQVDANHNTFSLTSHHGRREFFPSDWNWDFLAEIQDLNSNLAPHLLKIQLPNKWFTFSWPQQGQNTAVKFVFFFSVIYSLKKISNLLSMWGHFGSTKKSLWFSGFLETCLTRIYNSGSKVSKCLCDSNDGYCWPVVKFIHERNTFRGVKIKVQLFIARQNKS